LSILFPAKKFSTGIFYGILHASYAARLLLFWTKKIQPQSLVKLPITHRRAAIAARRKALKQPKAAPATPKSMQPAAKLQ